MDRYVFTLPDIEIKIYSEPEGTTIQDFLTGAEPVLTVDDWIHFICYIQNCTGSAATPSLQRRGVTGRGPRKLVAPSHYYDDVKLNFSELYIEKAAQYNVAEIFNPNKILRILIPVNNLFNPEELWTFGLARAQSFNISGSDDATIEISAQLEAEILK